MYHGETEDEQRDVDVAEGSYSEPGEQGVWQKGVVDPRLSKLRVADCKQLVADRDQLGSAVGEKWKDVQKRVRSASPHGKLPHWKLISCIVKSNDDVRQEQFATQLITLLSQIFRKAELPLWVRPYHVLATSYESGLIEMVPDTISLHGLKKRMAEVIAQQVCPLSLPSSCVHALRVREKERDVCNECRRRNLPANATDGDDLTMTLF